MTFSPGFYKVHIAEPESTGVLCPKYANAEQWHLATALRELVQAIGAQIAAPERTAREAASEIRESVFRRLLFGGDDAEQGDALTADRGIGKKL